MEQLDLLSWRPRRVRRKKACEWKIVAVRELNLSRFAVCEGPQQAVEYWRKHIATAAHFNPDVECFATLLLTVKNRIKGHHLVSIGLLNETVAHPREVFRAAVIGAAHSVILMHNHPSGDPSPSNADRRMTRLLVDASKLLNIAIQDHIIVGCKQFYSLHDNGDL